MQPSRLLAHRFQNERQKIWGLEVADCAAQYRTRQAGCKRPDWCPLAEQGGCINQYASAGTSTRPEHTTHPAKREPSYYSVISHCPSPGCNIAWITSPVAAKVRGPTLMVLNWQQW